MPILSIESNTFPFLCLAGNTAPEPWGNGMLYSLRLASSFIRITSKGLQYSTIGTFDAKHFSTAWHNFTCNVDNNALCIEPSNNMSIFPSHTSIPVYISQNQDRFSATKNNFLKAFPNDTACNRSYTGRVFTVEDNQYSLTLCDLIDQNLDIFVSFDDNETMIYWRRDKTSVWLLVFLAIVSIYLVSCIAQNIVRTIKGSQTSQHLHRLLPQRFITILLLLILYVDFFLVHLFDNSADNSFDFVIMQSDQRLLIHLFVYVTLEFFYQVMQDYHSWKQSTFKRTFASSVSILIACLVLIAFRIHFTADNPYITILTGLFGCRTWYKQLIVYTTAVPLSAVLMQIIDVWTFGSLLGNGIMNVQNTVFEGTILQYWIVFICSTVGSLLFIYNKSI